MTGMGKRTMKATALGILVVVVIVAVVWVMKGQPGQVKEETREWTNRITGLSTEIDAAWNEPKRMETETPAYMFTEKKDIAALIFGVEEYSDMDLRSYVDALLMSNAQGMNIPGEGEYGTFEGYDSWIGHGTLVQNPDYRCTVRVVVIRGDFWRTVMVHGVPFTYSDPLLERHEERVWRTILPVGELDDAPADGGEPQPVPEG